MTLLCSGSAILNKNIVMARVVGGLQIEILLGS